MNKLIWILILLLVVAHQDVWNWNNPTLVLGFFPLGLLYHVGISLVATVLWYLATVFCWPTEWIKSIEAQQPTVEPSGGQHRD